MIQFASKLHMGERGVRQKLRMTLRFMATPTEKGHH